jgi:hypothetical protein
MFKIVITFFLVMNLFTSPAKSDLIDALDSINANNQHLNCPTLTDDPIDENASVADLMQKCVEKICGPASKTNPSLNSLKDEAVQNSRQKDPTYDKEIQPLIQKYGLAIANEDQIRSQILLQWLEQPKVIRTPKSTH